MLVARKPGTISGLPLVAACFRKLAPDIEIRPQARDGETVAAKTVLMHINGDARAVLSAERVALNFLQHLSGIATATAAFVQQGGRRQDPHLLHAQDHAGPARAGEIRGALRRRLQPPLRTR